MIAYFSISQVIKFHKELIDLTGGNHGIRDRSLLESALAMPEMAAFGIEYYPTIPEKAAAYLFYICKNHPFIDGNKRIASWVAVTFIYSNDSSLKFSFADLEIVVCELAKGTIGKEEILDFFINGKIPSVCLNVQNLSE